MKIRETSYKDYGFDLDEAKRLKEYCQSIDFSDHITLLNSAISSNPSIASDLFYSLLNGISYENLTKVKYIPYSKGDFYGYQRQCLYIFRNLLLLFGKWK